MSPDCLIMLLNQKKTKKKKKPYTNTEFVFNLTVHSKTMISGVSFSNITKKKKKKKKKKKNMKICLFSNIILMIYIII